MKNVWLVGPMVPGDGHFAVGGHGHDPDVPVEEGRVLGELVLEVGGTLHLVLGHRQVVDLLTLGYLDLGLVWLLLVSLRWQLLHLMNLRLVGLQGATKLLGVGLLDHLVVQGHLLVHEVLLILLL